MFPTYEKGRETFTLWGSLERANLIMHLIEIYFYLINITSPCNKTTLDNPRINWICE